MRHSDLNNMRENYIYNELNVWKSRVPSGKTSGKNHKSRRAVRRSTTLGFLTLCFLIICFLTIGVLHSSAEAEQEHKFKYYTSVVIEEGDTLWSIADQYMDRSVQGKIAYIDEVKSINHIHDGDRITAGQMIIVPYYSTEYIAD